MLISPREQILTVLLSGLCSWIGQWSDRSPASLICILMLCFAYPNLHSFSVLQCFVPFIQICLFGTVPKHLNFLNPYFRVLTSAARTKIHTMAVAPDNY